jgi:hypothetical protein
MHPVHRRHSGWAFASPSIKKKLITGLSLEDACSTVGVRIAPHLLVVGDVDRRIALRGAVLGTDVTNQLETSGEVPVARESSTGSRSGTGLRLARSHVRAQPEPPRTQDSWNPWNFRNHEGRSLFLVSPRRGLRARHNPGDVRIVAARAGVRFGSAPLLRFQPARGLLLLFFLFCALARPFVLRGSRLLH